MPHGGRIRTVEAVTTPDGPLLLHLPVAYAVALALRDAGLDAADIARRLDLAVESMPALFEIAEAKLNAVRKETAGGGDRPSD